MSHEHVEKHDSAQGASRSQRSQSRGAIDGSPRQLAQQHNLQAVFGVAMSRPHGATAAMAVGVNNSARQIAQRRGLETAFGGAYRGQQKVQEREVIQRKLDPAAALALLEYYEKNYDADIERERYLSDIHRGLVLGSQSLEAAKDSLDAMVSSQRGQQTRGDTRAPENFDPRFVDSGPDRLKRDRVTTEAMLAQANQKRIDERKNLFCFVKFDIDGEAQDYESGTSHRGPLTLRYDSADAEQRMVADFPNLVAQHGGFPRSVTIITSASPCNAVCLPLLVGLIRKHAGTILSWQISFFEPYFKEEKAQYLNTIQSLNLVIAGPNGEVTVARAGLVPSDQIKWGAISAKGNQGRMESQLAVAASVEKNI